MGAVLLMGVTALSIPDSGGDPLRSRLCFDSTIDGDDDKDVDERAINTSSNLEINTA